MIAAEITSPNMLVDKRAKLETLYNRNNHEIERGVARARLKYWQGPGRGTA